MDALAGRVRALEFEGFGPGGAFVALGGSLVLIEGGCWSRSRGSGDVDGSGGCTNVGMCIVHLFFLHCMLNADVNGSFKLQFTVEIYSSVFFTLHRRPWSPSPVASLDDLSVRVAAAVVSVWWLLCLSLPSTLVETRRKTAWAYVRACARSAETANRSYLSWTRIGWTRERLVSGLGKGTDPRTTYFIVQGERTSFSHSGSQ